MENLWETKNKMLWHDYISRSRHLSQNAALALFIFGFIEIITTFTFLNLGQSAWNITIFSLAGMIFIFLFLFTIYRSERKHREITATFLYFVKRTSYVIIVVIFGTPYYILVLFPLFSYLFGVYSDQLTILIFAIEFAAIVIFNLRTRISPREAQPLDNENIVDKLKQVAMRLNIPYIQPMVVPGTSMKIANAYCSGLLHHKVWITDYVVNNLTDDELVAVIAHEYGHAKYHHVMWHLVPVSIIYLVFFSVLFYINFVKNLAPAIFPIVIAIVILTPYILYLPRTQAELSADRVAAGVTGVDSIISALRKLTQLNLVLPNRGSMSHPSLEARVNKLNRLIIKPVN